MSLAVSAFSFLLAWVGKIYCWQESVNDIKLHLYSIFNLSDFINIIKWLKDSHPVGPVDNGTLVEGNPSGFK
jgi:hypothetical protein